MKRACVIGWPVAHSRSPLIHGYWLRAHGIEGEYTRVPVQTEDAAGFLRSLRERGFVGCNVTLPHKETAFAIAAKTTPAARAVGVANTLWLDGGTLMADSTDGAGFVANMLATVPAFAIRDRVAAVLGAGGAARAIVHALLQEGAARVCIFNRTRSRAEAIAGHFGSGVEAADWHRRHEGSRGAALLVNTTSLGMRGSAPLDMDVDALAPGCVVADIVYVPLVTPLLAAAAARGLPTVDGLGMLLHQAVPGFEKWFGVRPAVTDDLRALLIKDIESG
jgi:shikimate dehydrogenase